MSDFSSASTLNYYDVISSNMHDNLIVCRIMICLILKGEILEASVVGDIAHKPAYFVPGNSWFLCYCFLKPIFFNEIVVIENCFQFLEIA